MDFSDIPGATLYKDTTARCGDWIYIESHPYIYRMNIACWNILMIFAGANDLFSFGSFCVPLDDVGNGILQCYNHCRSQMEVSRLSDAPWLMGVLRSCLHFTHAAWFITFRIHYSPFSECCCYSEASCRCKGPFHPSYRLPEDVLMLPGFDFPVEECPTSRVKAGYATCSFVVFVRVWPGFKKWPKWDACRKFDYFSDQNLPRCKSYLVESNVYFLEDDGSEFVFAMLFLVSLPG